MTHPQEAAESPAAPAKEYHRPPSVPEDIWDLVPEEMREEFVVRTALRFMKGIHPADSFLAILNEKGLSTPSAARSARRPPSIARKAA